MACGMNSKFVVGIAMFPTNSIIQGEHSEKRTGHRCGTRVRRFDTRMGTIYLLVPKVRKGGYIPFFVTERKRSENALIQVIQEAFINGVSTRKIERLAKSLGIQSISASQVSEMSKELNDQVEEFRNRPLEAIYPAIWIDALYEKIRDNGRVRNMAVHVVCAVNLEGKREILAIEPMYEESQATYTDLFNRLKERGLKEKYGWQCQMPTEALHRLYRSLLPVVAGKDAKCIL